MSIDQYFKKKTYIDFKSRKKYTNSKNINENEVSKNRVKIPYIYSVSLKMINNKIQMKIKNERQQ